MTDIGPITDAVVGALRERALFVFDSGADSELAGFFREPRALMPQPNPAIIEQARALSYLNAAEFALIPVLTNPDPDQIPPRAPIRVNVAWARLALLKGDCSLIIWTHQASQGSGLTTLPAEDIAVFAGDISKSSKLQFQSGSRDAGQPDLTSVTPLLESVHRESHWPLARQVAGTGVLPLQGLLWRLKRSVVAPDAIRTIQQEVEGFGTAIA